MLSCRVAITNVGMFKAPISRSLTPGPSSGDPLQECGGDLNRLASKHTCQRGEIVGRLRG